MKNLFVVHNINNIKKKEPEEIFESNYKKEIEKNISTLKNNENQLNINSSFQSTISNSSAESRKYSLNIPCQESTSSFIFKTSSNTNTAKIDKNQFLGKKVNFQFRIVKDNTDNMKNDELSNISKAIIKENEKNDISKKENLSKIIIFKKNNHKEKKDKKGNLNEGRWSYEEHIKFIEALVKFGKNWKDVQKYVGTRTTAQARSHAQKFLLKLKMFKTNNSAFDFSNSNIKNLLNVIEEIKRKKNNDEDEKQYVINTLINLSDSITTENNIFNKHIRKFKNIKKNKNMGQGENNANTILNNDDKKDLNNSHCLTTINNELNLIKLEEDEKKEETAQKTIFNNKSINEGKSNKKSENNAKKEESSLSNNVNCIKLFEDNSLKYRDYLYNSNKKLIVDDGIGYYLDDFDIINYNNTSLRVKDYYYNIYFESSSIINKHFFS
jgi:SHAQKYF class myb-like DNA-binding protein